MKVMEGGIPSDVTFTAPARVAEALVGSSSTSSPSASGSSGGLAVMTPTNVKGPLVVDLVGQSHDVVPPNFSFPELSTAVLKKIEHHIEKQRNTSNSLFTREQNAWFCWWMECNFLLSINRGSAEKCLRDALRDSVLPPNYMEHPKLVRIHEFIIQKLKNVKKTLMKELSAAVVKT